MRVYMNEREARLVKACLLNEMVMLNDGLKRMAQKLLDRIELCEKLQQSENKSKPG